MTLPDDRLNIDTPENVAFGYEVVGIGSRFLAAIIDTLLIALLQLIVNLILFFLAILFLGDLTERETSTLTWLAAVFGLISFAFFWGYYIFFEMAWNGQSPGKRWTGLRVIRIDGTPITMAESIIRNLIRVVDFLPVYYGVGVVTMFIDHQARRLGDLAAGTVVVRDQATVTLESLAARPAGPFFPSPVPAEAIDLPVERLTKKDIQIAEDFLRRREELANRSALAQQVARNLCERMDLPVREMYFFENEKFIQQVIQAIQNRDSQDR